MAAGLDASKSRYARSCGHFHTFDAAALRKIYRDRGITPEDLPPKTWLVDLPE